MLTHSLSKSIIKSTPKLISHNHSLLPLFEYFTNIKTITHYFKYFYLTYRQPNFVNNILIIFLGLVNVINKKNAL